MGPTPWFQLTDAIFKRLSMNRTRIRYIQYMCSTLLMALSPYRYQCTAWASCTHSYKPAGPARYCIAGYVGGAAQCSVLTPYYAGLLNSIVLIL